MESKSVKFTSAMHTEYNKAYIDHLFSGDLSWLSYIGEPMLYDGELFVLRRQLEPGRDTYRWYIGKRMV